MQLLTKIPLFTKFRFDILPILLFTIFGKKQNTPFFSIKFVVGKYLVFFFFPRKSAFKYPPGGMALWRNKSPCSPDGFSLLKDPEFIIIIIIIILFMYVLLFVLILLFRQYGPAWMILTTMARSGIRMVHRWITLTGVQANQAISVMKIVFTSSLMEQWQTYFVPHYHPLFVDAQVFSLFIYLNMHL